MKIPTEQRQVSYIDNDVKKTYPLLSTVVRYIIYLFFGEEECKQITTEQKQQITAEQKQQIKQQQQKCFESKFEGDINKFTDQNKIDINTAKDLCDQEQQKIQEMLSTQEESIKKRQQKRISNFLQSGKKLKDKQPEVSPKVSPEIKQRKHTFALQVGFKTTEFEQQSKDAVKQVENLFQLSQKTIKYDLSEQQEKINARLKNRSLKKHSKNVNNQPVGFLATLLSILSKAF